MFINGIVENESESLWSSHPSGRAFARSTWRLTRLVLQKAARECQDGLNASHQLDNVDVEMFRVEEDGLEMVAVFSLLLGGQSTVQVLTEGEVGVDR